MNPTPEQLDFAALHVGYELVQLAKMSRRLQDPTLPGDAHNACLESMLLHARSLIEFTIEGRGKANDLHRSEFLPKWAPPKGEEAKRLRRAMPVLHKHLAHLTWERVDEGSQEWDYGDVVADLLHVFGAFVAELRAAGAPGEAPLTAALVQARAAIASSPTRRMTPSTTTGRTG